MSPMLEYDSLLLQQIDVASFKGSHPIPKNVYMRPSDNRERIDLQIASMLYSFLRRT